MATLNATDSPEARGISISALWPTRLLGRRPGLKEANIVCWGLFIAFLLVPLCVVTVIQVRQGTGFIRRLHSDFVYFYGDGQIGTHSPARLYDYPLQQQVFSSIFPAYHGEYGPSPYPPFVALFFSLFSHLSFEASYGLWFGLSLVLYLLGIGAALGLAFPGEGLKQSLIYCFAVGCYPFLFSTLINAQLSSVAVCAVGVAIYEEKRGRFFVSGLILALLAYKPTLLVLIVPMLLLSRRFRAAAGFAAGAGALCAVSTLFAGIGVWQKYYEFLRSFSSLTGFGGASRLQLWKYVDLSSFFAAASGRQDGAGKDAALATSAVIAIGLATLLWRSARGSEPVQWLAWAATLTWTLLLNIYVPIYDSVLAVIAVILTLGALRTLGWRIANEWITLLSVVTLAISWKTVSFAQAHHVQLLSIALFLLGAAQLWLLWRAIERERAPVPAVVA